MKDRGEKIKNRLWRGQEGFSLIEILIAMTVFSVGLLALNVMQTSTIKGNKSADGLTGTTTWAENQIEQIMTWDYNDPRLIDDSNATSIDGSATSPDGVYTMEWFVVTDVPLVNTKTIMVTATRNLRGRPQTVILTCIKPLIN